MDTHYDSDLDLTFNALERAWPDAPVYDRDGRLAIVGSHPIYGPGHYAYRCHDGLRYALSRARDRHEAERAIRTTLGLPAGFAFGPEPTDGTDAR